MASVGSSCESLRCVFGHIGEVLLGTLLLLLGIVFVLTLWLMPLGLPLGLLGVALIEVGGSM